eukprot:359787-Chlamydomonas_euryale.AAC.4
MRRAPQHSGTAMASGSCGRKADVVLWDFASGAVRSCFQEHDMEVVVLAFSPDDRLLLTVGHEKWVWGEAREGRGDWECLAAAGRGDGGSALLAG